MTQPVKLETPRQVLDARGEVWRTFDLAPDGRLLAVLPQRMGNAQPLTAMINWTAGLSSAKPEAR